jgi:hypothetical protein
LKKLAFTIAILCKITPTLSQVLIALLFGEKLQSETLTFGLNVTPTFSTISNLDGSLKRGLGLGLYFDIKLSKDFFLHPEALPKSSLGVEQLPAYPTGIDSLDTFFANGQVERSVRAISLPLLCRYRIKDLLFAELGPQIDWMLKVKDTYYTDVNGDEATYTTDISDQFTRFDVGIAGGLHYKLKKDKGMGLGLRYFYGVSDIMKGREGKQVNQALYMNIMIPVGTGKGSGE